MKVTSLTGCRKCQVHVRRLPSQRHKRTPRATIWSLPEEIVLLVLRGLHIRDLLSLRSTSTYFRDLIDTNSSLWANADFQTTWPTQPNIRHFQRAYKHGNVEAMIKLGIAYLYNEGLPGDFAGQKITSNGEKAAEMFCAVETCTPNTPPFSWLFIRPPWISRGACCKECVFINMKTFVEQVPNASVCICIAQTLMLLDEESSPAEVEKYLGMAVQLGSSEAALLLWRHHMKQMVPDRAEELKSIRELRSIAEHNQEAQMTLCQMYAAGKFGGISTEQAASYVREFIQRSTCTRVSDIFKSLQLTNSMRYILMDWLVEVASMKEFSSLTLHVAISMVDRYLRAQGTTRSRLQLLGVAAMVISSRLLDHDIIPIREAAWLTDNTYKYEDVVRMLGEITAALNGNFRTLVSLDYVQLISALAKNDMVTRMMSEYICELALLHSDLGDFPKGQVAACSVLLARLVLKQEYPWPNELQLWTGFSVKELSKCTLVLHDKCFQEIAMVDHRDMMLQAVKQRYGEESKLKVSSIKVLTTEELHSQLGVPRKIMVAESKCVYKPEVLIMSPSRRSSSCRSDKYCPMEPSREKAATPSLEEMEHSLLDASALSGYDGDYEDEGESFLSCDEYSDDLATLWCADLVSDPGVKVKSALGESCSPPKAYSLPKLNLAAPDNAQYEANGNSRMETPHGHSGLMTLIHAINSQAQAKAASCLDFPASSQSAALLSSGMLISSQSSLASLSTGQSSTTSQLGFSVYYDPKRRQSLPGSSTVVKSQSNMLREIKPTPLSDVQNMTESVSSQVKPRKRKNSQQIGNENKVYVS